MTKITEEDFKNCNYPVSGLISDLPESVQKEHRKAMDELERQLKDPNNQYINFGKEQ